MRTSEVMRRAGVTRDTLRHYLKCGLLTEAHYTTQANGYRVYNEVALERLEFIRYGQMAGFTLAQIATVADEWANGGLSFEQKCALMGEQLAAIDARIAELEQLKGYVALIIDKERAKAVPGTDAAD